MLIQNMVLYQDRYFIRVNKESDSLFYFFDYIFIIQYYFIFSINIGDFHILTYLFIYFNLFEIWDF